MLAFLAAARQALSLAGPAGRTVVIGNQAGDADSIISALAHAYWLGCKRGPDEPSGAASIPMLPISHDDLRLRPETMSLLSRCGIPPEALVSVAEPAARRVLDDAATRVVLVDHNKPCEALAHIEPRVVAILDHHQDEHACLQVTSPGARDIAFDAASRRGIGSTCTLVAERFVAGTPGALTPEVATLLLGVICVDTVNLSESVGKATARDVDAVASLERYLAKEAGPQGWGPTSRQQLFDQLMDSKFDATFWASLTARQALSYDYKDVVVAAEPAPLRVGMSSVLTPVAALARDGEAFGHAVRAFAAERGLQALIVMTFVTAPAPARELLLCGVDHPSQPLSARTLSALQATLQESSDLALERCPAQDVAGGLFFQQSNIKASRKQVLPLVAACLRGLAE